jgi:hypothetical protein
MTMFQHTPSEARQSVIECMEVGLVPMVTSSPGLGKSAMVKKIAKDFGLQLIDLRLSQCTPEDLMGLPMRKEVNGEFRAAFTPFEMFPLASDKVPEGKNGWLLFLDEFNSATKMVQAAAYKLALDKMVGQEHLHENCFVVCAGNLATDRAIVNQMSTAMQSRLCHIEMVLDHKDFMKMAVENDFDYRVLGFLEYMPSKLHHFVPDHDDRTFACPRTWEFCSKLIKDKPIDKLNLKLLGGTVSEGIAVEFMTFVKEYDKLPSFKTILTNPAGTPVPSESSTVYALVTMLLNQISRGKKSVDMDDFSNVVTYVKRIPAEFQIIFFRGIQQRFPELHRTKDFVNSIIHLTKFIREIEENVGPITVAA